MVRKKAGRRANGEGSVYESPKGSGQWWAEISLPNGKTKRARAKSQAEALKKRDELKAELAQGVDLSKKRPTFSAWYATWLAEYCEHVRPGTRRLYSNSARHITATVGRKAIDQLTPAALQAWINDLARAISPQTAKNVRIHTHIALNEAVRQGYLVRNPIDGVKVPQSNTRKITPLDFEQTRQLLAAAQFHRLYALIRIAVNLGPRVGELAGLTWDCFDDKKKTLTVRQQLAEGGAGQWALAPTKGSDTRVFALDDDLVDTLLTHRRQQAEERAFRLSQGLPNLDPFLTKHGGLLFTSETGAPFSRSHAHYFLKKLLRAAGLPNIRFHDLRHTAATLMLADGVPLVTVSKILGHSSVAITANVYAHALDESKASAVASLSAKLQRGGK